MRAEEPDRHDSGLILQAGNQPVVIAFDVENHAAGLENTRLRVRRLDVLGISPLRGSNNVEPSLILGACRLDPLMAGMSGKIGFDHLDADDDH